MLSVLVFAVLASFPNAPRDFTLKSAEGRPVSLREGEPKATVLWFMAAECPVAKLYAPRVAELERATRSRGARFLAIDSNYQDDAAQVSALGESARIEFPMLLDPDQRVADAFGVTRSSEVVVLDPELKVRYQGAVDDQYGPGTSKPAPTAPGLSAALDAVLSGREPSVSATKATGCLLGRMPAERREGKVTFHRDVLPILQHNCQVCHRPGEIGPMPLLDYDDAAGWAPMIAEVVEAGRMPPWHADPRFGKFVNRRGLSDQERATLIAWAAAKAPEGDRKNAPPPIEWPSQQWHIGAPDLVVSMSGPFNVPAQGTVEYKYFRVPTHLTEDRWVKAIEVRPGNRAVVHHILVFVEDPQKRRESLDEFQGGLNGYFGVCVPGQGPTIYPDGTAQRLPNDSNLIFQVHYTPNGSPQQDVSSVGFQFTDEEITQQVMTRGIFNLGIKIPPGKKDVTFQATYEFEQAASILNLFPHMHLRGQSFRYELEQDGTRQTLLSVPAYDFRWQHLYRFAQPIPVEKGARVICTAQYDNTKENPNNPNPSTTVRWGDQTWEEMLLGYIDFVVDE